MKKIVATCPHCVRTISEYKDFGLDPDIQVIHHAPLIDNLIASGKIKLDGGAVPPGTASAAKVVYHDPCYLSRYGQKGDITTPRRLLHEALGESPLEPERTCERSFCCGAGGAMIFAEETQGKRINRERTEELLRADATQIAVACPFCQIMVRDATGDLGRSDDVQVKDIAQFVAERIGNPA